jgi:Domain of unknown function (DUF6438)
MRLQTTIFSLCAIVCFVLMQCGATKKTKSKALPPNSPLIRLATGGCRGYCPIFSITIDQKGTCTYTPERNCAVQNEQTFQLTKTETASLQKQISTLPFRVYPERFESFVADAPPSIMTFFTPDSTYIITGTLERPRPLIALEEKIRGFALAHGIDTRKSVNPNDIPTGQAGELIVQLKEQINAGNWITTIQTGNPKLVRRMPTNNTWLIKYDQKEVTMKDMILLLEANDDVLKVQKNMRADDRGRD